MTRIKILIVIFLSFYAFSSFTLNKDSSSVSLKKVNKFLSKHYLGGPLQFYTDLFEKIKYPAIEREKGIEQQVIFNFSVIEKGKVKLVFFDSLNNFSNEVTHAFKNMEHKFYKKNKKEISFKVCFILSDLNSKNFRNCLFPIMSSQKEQIID